jgi:hypothetical protein
MNVPWKIRQAEIGITKKKPKNKIDIIAKAKTIIIKELRIINNFYSLKLSKEIDLSFIENIT